MQLFSHKRASLLLLSMILLGGRVLAQNGELIAGWHFNAYGGENTADADAGNGTIYMDGSNGSDSWTGTSNFAGTTVNIAGLPGDPGAGNALCPVGSNNGKYMVIRCSMTGYTNLEISFATRGTATGFNSGTWSYSTNGTSWTSFGGNTATTSTSFSTRTLNAPAALDNAANVYLRYQLNGASNTSGNNRIDNLQLRGTGTPLAIVLGQFSGNAAASGVQLRWSSLAEDAGDRFVLERSADGSTFTPLASLKARGIPGSYSYTDKQPLQGNGFYRLALHHHDNTRTYSGVVQVSAGTGQATALRVYPNPATEVFTLSLDHPGNAPTLLISDLGGRTLLNRAVAPGDNRIDISALPAGTYLLRYTDDAYQHTTSLVKH